MASLGWITGEGIASPVEKLHRLYEQKTTALQGAADW